MTKLARLLAAVGLLSFSTLAACADDVTPPATAEDDIDEVSEALSDDEGGSELPASAYLNDPPPPPPPSNDPPPINCGNNVDFFTQLMILRLAVVEDPVRTKWTGDLENPSDGAWQFGRLMTNMAGEHEPAAFVERWLHRWEKDRPVNGFNVAARPSFKSVVTDAWPKRADGHIDLTKAPMRLLAIVNRMDLRRLDKGHAGEGRFVFGVLDSAGNPLEFTVILEYRLPAKTEADVTEWARLWAKLGHLEVGTAAYSEALQTITDKFAGKNAAPDRPNGSAIGQIRTNEIAFAPEWELREFRVSKKTGNIYSATVKQTPDLSLQSSSLLGDWVNDHESELLDGTSWVTPTTSKKSFRAGSALTPFGFFWNPPGVKNNDARHRLSLNTCNGCHSGETQTQFLHVSPRAAGVETQISRFLGGENIPDPVTGENRFFGDLMRRAEDFSSIACGF